MRMIMYDHVSLKVMNSVNFIVSSYSIFFDFKPIYLFFGKLPGYSIEESRYEN